MTELPARLAAGPPYVLIANFDGAGHDPDPSQYEELIKRPGIQLYRKRGLGPAAASAPAPALPAEAGS
jgi:hypothetical protein